MSMTESSLLEMSVAPSLPEILKPIKVSALVAILKNDVEKKHRYVRVIGELSSLKKWRSGHWYFDIKDEEAVLPAVMFRPHAERLPFQVHDGMEVLFIGRISIYPATSRLQMIVESMEPLGQGALALAFEQLKSKLQGLGLFDAEKKALPYLSRCVGIVTSPQGAVLRDMVRIIKKLQPGLNIVLMPVRVQGVGAREEIADGIRRLDQSGLCDVIIVARGGGSLEDLWAFNEEIVAYAIHECKTPIVSAVGHETDTSISDFVADMRAATPTHAAQLIARNVDEELIQLHHVVKRLTSSFKRVLHEKTLELLHTKKELKDPRLMLLAHWQNLDQTLSRLMKVQNDRLVAQKRELLGLKDALLKESPWHQLAVNKEHLFHAKMKLEAVNIKNLFTAQRAALIGMSTALYQSFTKQLTKHRHDFLAITSKLDALSPLKVMGRGYTLVENKSGVITSVQHLTINDTVSVRFSDGIIEATICQIRTNQ